MSYVPQIRANRSISTGMVRLPASPRAKTRRHGFPSRTDVETQIVESHYKPNQTWP